MNLMHCIDCYIPLILKSAGIYCRFMGAKNQESVERLHHCYRIWQMSGYCYDTIHFRKIQVMHLCMSMDGMRLSGFRKDRNVLPPGSASLLPLTDMCIHVVKDGLRCCRGDGLPVIRCLNKFVQHQLQSVSGRVCYTAHLIPYANDAVIFLKLMNQ